MVNLIGFTVHDHVGDFEIEFCFSFFFPQNLKKYKYRFQFVIDEMKASEVVEYSTALVAFVNCVIISLASLNERVRIRNEFLGKYLFILDSFAYSLIHSSPCFSRLKDLCALAVEMYSKWV